jgi:hypothetical protein
MAWFKQSPHGSGRIVDVAWQRHRLFGRRYLADAPYMLPSDDAEINRLDFQHYLLRYALRGNYLAPIGRPRHPSCDRARNWEATAD